MYSKEVTALIMQDWARGFSAEETRNHIHDALGVKPCINTIYAHRNSLTTQNLIDELLNQQEREIFKAGAGTKDEEGKYIIPPNQKIAMHYRNELLKILLPIKILSFNKTEITENINRNLNLTNYSEEDKTAILDAYRRLRNAEKNSSQTQPPCLH